MAQMNGRGLGAVMLVHNLALKVVPGGGAGWFHLHMTPYFTTTYVAAQSSCEVCKIKELQALREQKTSQTKGSLTAKDPTTSTPYIFSSHPEYQQDSGQTMSDYNISHDVIMFCFLCFF